MWKYYISAITHTATSDYELYSFLRKESPFVKKLKSMPMYVGEADMSSLAAVVSPDELAQSRFRWLIS